MLVLKRLTAAAVRTGRGPLINLGWQRPLHEDLGRAPITRSWKMKKKRNLKWNYKLSPIVLYVCKLWSNPASCRVGMSSAFNVSTKFSWFSGNAHLIEGICTPPSKLKLTKNCKKYLRNKIWRHFWLKRKFWSKLAYTVKRKSFSNLRSVILSNNYKKANTKSQKKVLNYNIDGLFLHAWLTIVVSTKRLNN